MPQLYMQGSLAWEKKLEITFIDFRTSSTSFKASEIEAFVADNKRVCIYWEEVIEGNYFSLEHKQILRIMPKTIMNTKISTNFEEVKLG